MAELVWTKDKPTEPGWYWFRHEHIAPWIAHVELLCRFGKAPFLAVRMQSIHTLDKFDGEWAGPIPQPKEATR
jgi:hypothetical protein